MTGKLKVRRCRARDLAFAHRDREIPARVIARMIREGDIFIAESRGRRVGLARLEYLWGKTPLLTSLWVEPGSRRRGVALALLAFVESLLLRRGHGVLYSSTMPDNPIGLKWHRATGFRRCGFMSGVNPGGVGEVFFCRQLVARSLHRVPEEMEP